MPVPVTVAVNACECPTCTVADGGPTVTFTLPLVIAGRAKATTVNAGTVRLVERSFPLAAEKFTVSVVIVGLVLLSR